jgi:hypothetical protein
MPQPPYLFDVFLSHNSKDKPVVTEIARILRNDYELKPWLDIWQRIPGSPWEEMLEQGLTQSATVAVFIGDAGFGRWENEEMRVAVNALVGKQTVRVIPVLLPGAPEQPELPMFLSRYTWVDLRNGYQAKDLLFELFCGIAGISPGDREAATRQTPVANSITDGVRERSTIVSPANTSQGGESSQQYMGRVLRRDLSNPPTEEGLKISRRQLTNLDQAQRNLKDFVDASIIFGEVWADCDHAKSKLRDEIENPTEDLSSFGYWNDLKELLKHAKTKIDEETATFLRPKSEFVQFSDALDSALQLIETVNPKGAKSKKLETITKAYDHIQNAVMKAQAIVETCQEGAKDKLKDISIVIQSIFEGEQLPAEGASIQRQDVPRGSDRVPVSDNRLNRTSSQPGR